MNGCETYVRNCLDEGDMSWVPNHTCLALEKLKGDEDEAEVDVGKKVEKVEQGLKRLEDSVQLILSKLES